MNLASLSVPKFSTGGDKKFSKMLSNNLPKSVIIEKTENDSSSSGESSSESEEDSSSVDGDFDVDDEKELYKQILDSQADPNKETEK